MLKLQKLLQGVAFDLHSGPTRMKRPLLPDAFVWLWLAMMFRGMELPIDQLCTPLSRLSSKRFASSGVKFEVEGGISPSISHVSGTWSQLYEDSDDKSLHDGYHNIQTSTVTNRQLRCRIP